MKRIVSLLPSATEWACALGFKSHLVGRSHACDYPPSVTSLPVCTRARIPTDVPSLSIDEAVKEHLHARIPLYEVNRAQLKNLAPDVILTQSHCEVCAVTRKDVEALLGTECLASTTIVSLLPNRLEDVWNDGLSVAKAMEKPTQGKDLIARLKHRITRITENCSAQSFKPRVACIEWTDPLMAAGNWVPELVELAGGVNVVGHAGEHSPWLSWLELEASDPDIIVVLPCGFDLARTKKEVHPLRQNPTWLKLRAVQKGQVFIVDGHHYFNRPGPRLVESLEILSEIFHPEAARFGHQRSAWEKFSSALSR